MDFTDIEQWRRIGLIIAGIMLLNLVIFGILLTLAYRQLKKMHIPPDADFRQTIRLVPLFLVLAIDLLDFTLDILAVPIVWVILDRLGLKALRNVSAIEALVPFTQPIPTLTIAWLGVRFLNL